MKWNDQSAITEKDRQLLEKYNSYVGKNYYINKDLYERYNVKKGLRNADGTGVLVGLTNIGDVHSYIIDEGEKVPVEGRLLYRGIDIYDLVEGFQRDKRFGFEECCYLLLFGELPSKHDLEEFNRLLGSNRELQEGFTRETILKAPSWNIMNKLARSVLASYSYDENPEDLGTENVIRQCITLIASFPTMIAYGYQALAHCHYNESLHIHSPLPEKSTAENLLHLIRPDGAYSQLEAESLDLALVLHAEHGGGNNSTFTAHVVSSSATDTYSSVAAALASLKGSLHGGANIKVMGMMENIKNNLKDWEDEDEIENYLLKLLKGEAFDNSGLIYGLGHAVYTLSDPRAVLLKEKAASLAAVKGEERELELYYKIEKLAPQVFNRYKESDKPMCVNVDFYSGFVYKMLNIQVELYTPLFACGRIAGWSAHILEEIINGSKIIRPAFKNLCAKMDYQNLADR
ncbi:MAG: citrate/2-methylcitrate synthase [Eubacteriales bacterium]|nr:citrate/2-methylcitrate synthase [Eubacteriales bacterium]